jgi:hypothetical protein
VRRPGSLVRLVRALSRAISAAAAKLTARSFTLDGEAVVRSAAGYLRQAILKGL